MRSTRRTGPYVLPLLPLLLGLLFFAASLTPTLIPRSWLVQGVLGGVVMAIGPPFPSAMWQGIVAWRNRGAVTAPPDWTDEDTACLIARCSAGFHQGCDNE